MTDAHAVISGGRADTVTLVDTLGVALVDDGLVAIVDDASVPLVADGMSGSGLLAAAGVGSGLLGAEVRLNA